MPSEDTRFMQAALSMAQRNLGQTWPNPTVGAVVVKDGQIIGEGATARGGRPHAEPQALAQAGNKAKGATLYVSLEPCAHQGKTPPCTQAIIEAGIARVVIACRDPHPDVNGRGVAQLQAAGVNVIERVCEQDALAVNEGFFSVVKKNRPFVALKIAASADGKITHPTQRWLTGEAAREEVHRLRSQYDAIVTGMGTVLADDPLLNVRIAGLEDKSPVRVVLDRQGRLSAHSHIAKTSGHIKTWVLSTPTIAATLAYLTQQGITRLMVEAGRTLSQAFLDGGVVDRIYWFQAPVLAGENALSAPVFSRESWKCVQKRSIDNDTLEIYEPCSPAS